MAIFGREIDGLSVSEILPFLDRDDKGILEWARVSWKARYCANFEDGSEGHGWVPCTVEVLKTDIPASDRDGSVDLRISYLPHIAGVLVLDAKELTITSSNSAFSSALFGRRNLCGLEIGEVLPNFRRLVHFLARELAQQRRRNSITVGANVPEQATIDEDDDLILQEGTVVPEHAFRRAEAMLELRHAAGADMTPSTSSTGSSFCTESDSGAELVGTLSLGGSEAYTPLDEEVNVDEKSDGSEGTSVDTSVPALREGLLSGGLLIKPHGLRGVHRDGGEVVVDVQMRVVRPSSDSPGFDNIYYALWITYSGPRLNIPPLTPLPPVEPDSAPYTPTTEEDTFSSDDEIPPEEPRRRRSSVTSETTGIDAWEIIEEMGEGAYGSVKLVRKRRYLEQVTPFLYVSYSRPQL
jgi:protein-serine/threonine kinase